MYLRGSTDELHATMVPKKLLRSVLIALWTCLLLNAVIAIKNIRSSDLFDHLPERSGAEDDILTLDAGTGMEGD